MLQGFCLPEELSDEMDGEGEGTFNTSEGAGLADGQGAKDVSDQVQATSLPYFSITSHIVSFFFQLGKEAVLCGQKWEIYICACVCLSSSIKCLHMTCYKIEKKLFRG